MPTVFTQQPPPGQGQGDASYSMLFSPAASSLASTPGGGNDHHHHHGGGTTPIAAASGGGKGNGTSNNLELEVNWDPSLVKSELLQASAILSHRCLKLASNWAATQMAGVPLGHAASLGGKSNGAQLLQEEYANMTETDWYAKSLVDLGEYLHAAAVLSQTLNGGGSSSSTTEITQVGPPQAGLSSYGFYLRAYTLYMAGERRKEEDYVELRR